jgi:hypothetical protein
MNEYYLLLRWLPCSYRHLEQKENVAFDLFLRTIFVLKSPGSNKRQYKYLI